MPPDGPGREVLFGVGAVNRRLAWLAVALVVVAAIAIGVFTLRPQASAPEASTIGGPFNLVDQRGRPVDQRVLDGKWSAVFFGYTFCPDVCPTTLNAVADAMDKLGPAASQVRPLFITIDPARDTPAVVKQFAAAFGSRITGLTGTPEEIAKVAKEYHVYYAEHRTGPGPNDYSMDHSSILYLMDPKGGFVAPVGADQTGDEMAANLKKLMG
jgi:protein SCO1